VELTAELVGRLVPGDVVVVTGIVKALSATCNTGRQGGGERKSGLLNLVIEGIGLQNVSRGGSVSGAGGEFQSDVVSCLTEQDVGLISSVANGGDCFYELVHSLCPLILGHESVKIGLLLALFGGCSGEESNKRPDVHCLIVGEAGMGKSQLLRACAEVSPKGIFVTGNTSSTSGLTVTLAKDGNGEFSLEAGALVLADMGVCCIDEFDKLTAEQSALLESMEQQTISIAKAGIVCTLSSRTSILAAANPVGGTYKGNRTFSENVKLSGPLLSRFDLIYVLLDNPADRDDMIAQHVTCQGSTLDNRGTCGEM
jgi:DNA helicase MCM8